jgi:hypothetical protein
VGSAWVGRVGTEAAGRARLHDDAARVGLLGLLVEHLGLAAQVLRLGHQVVQLLAALQHIVDGLGLFPRARRTQAVFMSAPQFTSSRGRPKEPREGPTSTAVVSSNSFWIAEILSALDGSWNSVIAVDSGANSCGVPEYVFQLALTHPDGVHTRQSQQRTVWRQEGCRRRDAPLLLVEVLDKLVEQGEGHARRVLLVGHHDARQPVAAHEHVAVVLCAQLVRSSAAGCIGRAETTHLRAAPTGARPAACA